jgi:hypothetical protein
MTIAHTYVSARRAVSLALRRGRPVMFDEQCHRRRDADHSDNLKSKGTRKSAFLSFAWLA